MAVGDIIALLALIFGVIYGTIQVCYIVFTNKKK